jgi:hypothetical protein
LLLAQPIFDFVVRDALAGLGEDHGNLAGVGIDLDAVDGAVRARDFALIETIGATGGVGRA